MSNFPKILVLAVMCLLGGFMVAAILLHWAHGWTDIRLDNHNLFMLGVGAYVGIKLMLWLAPEIKGW